MELTRPSAHNAPPFRGAERAAARDHLLQALRTERVLWSYSDAAYDALTDDDLIEQVLLHLDLDDLRLLFRLFPRRRIHKLWRQRIATLGDFFRTQNLFLAFWAFDAKHPEAYLKSLETRHLNKLTL